MRDEAQFANRLVLDHLQAERLSAIAQQDEMALSVHHELRDVSPYGVWVAPLGGFGTGSGANGAPGYSTTHYGMAVGVDGRLAPGWVDGFAVQYTHTSLNQSGGGHATINTPRIEAYTGYWRGHYAIDLVIGDGGAKITTTRNALATLTSTYNGTPTSETINAAAGASYAGNETTAALQASGNYALGQAWALSPAVGVRFARLTFTGATESGASNLDYRTMHDTQNSVKPFVSVSAARRYYMNNGWALSPSAQIGFEDEVGNKGGQIHAQTFGDAYVWTVTGVKPQSTAVDVNLGIALETTKRQSFSLKLMGTEGSGSRDQTILAQYGLRF